MNPEVVIVETSFFKYLLLDEARREHGRIRCVVDFEGSFPVPCYFVLRCFSPLFPAIVGPNVIARMH